MIAETATDVPVNASQLANELGGASLRVIGPDPDGVTVIRVVDEDGGVPVQQAALESAVANHDANPDWTDPNPPAPTQAQLDAARLDELRTKAADKTITDSEVLEASALVLALGVPT